MERFSDRDAVRAQALRTPFGQSPTGWLPCFAKAKWVVKDPFAAVRLHRDYDHAQAFGPAPKRYRRTTRPSATHRHLTATMGRISFRERPWRSVKYEEAELLRYGSVSEARASIGRYLTSCNGRTRHSLFDRRTPDHVDFNRGFSQPPETQRTLHLAIAKVVKPRGRDAARA